MTLALTDFNYPLPQSAIAQTPSHPPDHAKLLHLDRATNSLTHHHFYDLPSLLPPKTQIIANNTKVFPARLYGHKNTGAKVEVLLLKKLPHRQYQAICSPGLKVNDVLNFTGVQAVVTKVEDRVRTLRFSIPEPGLTEILSKIGTMPTPPYIKKMLENNSDYQTIYAKYGFSAAAPTAGLHLTKPLLKIIKNQFNWHELTLDVGLGTFLPVKTQNINEHHMHEESYRITPTLCSTITQSLDKSPILAIGTTTLRALESDITPGTHKTKIFIYPPYKFQRVQALVTNFHLPQSTLLMLVSAFCSYPNSAHHFTNFQESILGKAYANALAHDYKFFSFGDAMLIT